MSFLELECEIRKLGIDDLQVAAFLAELVDIVLHYKDDKNRQLPSEVRSNIRKLDASIQSLLSQLHNLDTETNGLVSACLLMDCDTQPQSFLFDIKQRRLAVLQRAVKEAGLVAGLLPNGRPRLHARDYLCFRVAKAFKNHVGKDPTKTDDGPFEKIVRAVLKEAMPSAKNAPLDIGRQVIPDAIDALHAAGGEESPFE